MLKNVITILIGATLMFAAPAFAVDGAVLINQSTVMAQGGFPYKITQPGSYKLSGNLVVPANLDGIYILSNDVTLDLNGFLINGPKSCTGSSGATLVCDVRSPAFLSGISSPTNVGNVTIRNGSITGFDFGIESGGHNYLIEEIHATGNTDSGLLVSDAIIRRNTLGLNGSWGLRAQNSTVIENICNNNGAVGMAVSGVYGGNTLMGNGVGAVENLPGAVSQNNNDCNGVSC